jgi:hypothetical protein
MPTLVFRLKQLEGLSLSESSATFGVVFQDEIHKGLTNNHADLDWLAGLFPSLAATALENCHFRRSLEHQIPRCVIRDDLLKVSQGDLFVNGDDGLGFLQRKHLAMIVITQPLFSSKPEARHHMVKEQVNVFLDPAAVNITMQCTSV